jgi:hypothetical protein
VTARAVSSCIELYRAVSSCVELWNLLGEATSLDTTTLVDDGVHLESPHDEEEQEVGSDARWTPSVPRERAEGVEARLDD